VNRSPGKIPIRLGRRIVTQAWLAEIASLKVMADSFLEEAKQKRYVVIRLVESGALVEAGRYKVRIETRFGRRVLARKTAPIAPLAGSGSRNQVIVTQLQLQKIADLESAAKFLIDKWRGQRRLVLEAVQAGASVEPGRFKVHIRTRWRRRKAS
jgi:hypothetical protein